MACLHKQGTIANKTQPQTEHNRQVKFRNLGFHFLSLLRDERKSESILRMQRPKRLCHCVGCGGESGPGKLISYATFCRHAVQNQAQPSASFNNILASISHVHTSSQPEANVDLTAVSLVHVGQQQQMTLDDPLSTDSEEVRFLLNKNNILLIHV